MGKIIIATKETNWIELKDIYIRVLKQNWDIGIERVRENGSYILKLTKEREITNDLSNFQMGEMCLRGYKIYRVLNPVEEQ